MLAEPPAYLTAAPTHGRRIRRLDVAESLRTFGALLRDVGASVGTNYLAGHGYSHGRSSRWLLANRPRDIIGSNLPQISQGYEEDWERMASGRLTLTDGIRVRAPRKSRPQFSPVPCDPERSPRLSYAR